MNFSPTTDEFISKRNWGPEPRYPHVLDYPEQEEGFITIAGPCSIEDEDQVDKIAKVLKDNDVTFFRGGVFRAGTYPPKEFGLKKELLEMSSRKCKEYGLKNIIEVLDVRDIEFVDQYADAFQVGARHMQDYALLNELSKSEKTVTLKRNMGSTLDEFLGATEYLCKGNCKPILIERGSSTFMNHVRWDLSLSLIATVKRTCNIPILVDASHGTGRRDIVEPMTYAGIVAGADGFLLEVHPNPCKSLSDSDQALNLGDYNRIKVNSKFYHERRK